MKPEELEAELIDHERTLGDRHDVLFKLIALWKAAAEYARLNHQVNSNFNEAMRDPITQKAEWDAKVAMVDALKALEDK